jgi:ABC-type spermidine/putrescine transport system permease subunit II
VNNPPLMIDFEITEVHITPTADEINVVPQNFLDYQYFHQLTPSVPDSVRTFYQRVTTVVSPYWNSVVVCAFVLGLLIGMGICYGIMAERQRNRYRHVVDCLMNGEEPDTVMGA